MGSPQRGSPKEGPARESPTGFRKGVQRVEFPKEGPPRWYLTESPPTGVPQGDPKVFLKGSVPK